MRFYLDECINPEIASQTRDLGIDITEWKTDRMQGTTDEAQLRHAAKAGRCMVTSNCRHFRKHTRAFQIAGEAHAGVLCLKPDRFDMSDAAGIAHVLAQFAHAHAGGLAPYAFVSDSHVIRGLSG